MTLLYVNDDDENPAGSDTTLRDAPLEELGVLPAPISERLS